MAGPSALKHPTLRRLRAKRMILMRVQGHSKRQIAKDLQLSTDTVERELQWADRQGLIQSAEDTILQDLVPLAVQVMQQALEDESVGMKERLKAADRILTGTGVLKKEVAAEAPDDPKDEVEVWMLKRRTHGGALQQAAGAAAVAPDESRQLTSGPVAPVVEAEVVEGDDDTPVAPVAPIAPTE